MPQENQLPPPSRTRDAAGRRAKRGLALALETVAEEEEQPSCQPPSADNTAHADPGAEERANLAYHCLSRSEATSEIMLPRSLRVSAVLHCGW